MTSAPQSTLGLRRLPACIAGLWLVFAPSLGAQQRQETSAAASFRKDPGGVVLATVPKGTGLEIGSAKGDWTEAALEGWVYNSSLENTKRDGFDLVVSNNDGENLRAAPNGTILARLSYGTLLKRLERKGTWTRVRREGWISRSAVPQPAATTKPKPAVAARPDTARSTSEGARAAGTGQAPARKAAPDSGAAPDSVQRVELTRASVLREVPNGGAARATLSQGATGRVVGRAGDWVRVQMEGWVPAADVAPAADGTLIGVTAAEVRADPDRYVGQAVQWRVQLVSVQVADELRPELPAGQPYLLTRGPLPEPGFVYVAIPQAQAERFRAMPPLQTLVIRATILAARTRYLATPVVELISAEPAGD